ncbi:hypothetical protein FHS18_001175 [Paenibacillus phyllosphaerae]|uniref:Uncharacterized protein n=1 Tax=Paenibacillus phyllosphaerae TaxID=274593 RepID=A0A7W5FLI3_9BACL|nr:hypothetical protein [Paenibacillus phyllosphaerae]
MSEKATNIVESFHNDEIGYKEWFYSNLNGYIFNHFGTAEMNKLHHASCSTLKTKKYEGRWTSYEKFCSNDLRALVKEADQVTKVGWSFCKLCEKKGLLFLR